MDTIRFPLAQLDVIQNYSHKTAKQAVILQAETEIDNIK